MKRDELDATIIASQKWLLLETLLSDKGWPRDFLTPYEIADRFPARWQAPSGDRYDTPLPLDDEEADE